MEPGDYPLSPLENLAVALIMILALVAFALIISIAMGF